MRAARPSEERMQVMRRYLRAGLLSLGISAILGAILIVADGGWSGQHTARLAGMAVLAFVVFWIIFAGRRPPPNDHILQPDEHEPRWWA